MTGTIKRLSERGFGFIACEGERDGSHFFHAKSLIGLRFDELQVGQRVTFESTSGEKGLIAVQIQEATNG